MIRISVVIPVYNVEEYIRRCIDSIISQSYRNLDIILVDDGSTDSSGMICDEYAQRDDRIRVIHKANGGLVSARKAGLKIAEGDYISNIDSDDWIEQGAYEYMAQIAESHDADMVCCSFYKDYGDISEERIEYLNSGLYLKEDIFDEMARAVEKEPFYCPIIHDSLCTKLFKRELLLKAQLQVDERIVVGEDDSVVLPLILKCKKIYVTQKSFYHYCVRKTSVSWEKQKDTFKRLRVLALYLKKEFVDYAWEREDIQQNSKEVIKKYYLYTIASFWLDIADIADDSYLEQRNELPFWTDVKRGDSIVVYGKGLWANNIINLINRTGFCNVVANADSADAESVFESIDADCYKFIVIAIGDFKIAPKVEKYLLDLGISQQKILRIKKKNIKEEYIPLLSV